MKLVLLLTQNCERNSQLLWLINRPSVCGHSFHNDNTSHYENDKYYEGGRLHNLSMSTVLWLVYCYVLFSLGVVYQNFAVELPFLGCCLKVFTVVLLSVDAILSMIEVTACLSDSCPAASNVRACCNRSPSDFL